MKITKIFRNNKDKLGNPLKTRDGRPYERLAIKTDTYGDKYLSGFSADWNRDWQIGYDIGETIKVVESEGRDKNGDPYLNFTQVTKEDVMEEAIKNLELRVSKLEKMFSGSANPQNLKEVENNSFENEEFDEKSLPF